MKDAMREVKMKTRDDGVKRGRMMRRDHNAVWTARTSWHEGRRQEFKKEEMMGLHMAVQSTYPQSSPCSTPLPA